MCGRLLGRAVRVENHVEPRWSAVGLNRQVKSACHRCARLPVGGLPALPGKGIGTSRAVLGGRGLAGWRLVVMSVGVQV